VRDDKRQSVSCATTVQAGVLSSALTFSIRWIPDCVVNRKIVNSKARVSFLNIGIMWDLAYRVPANAVVFPAQYHLRESVWSQLDEKAQTAKNKIVIHAATGWLTSMVEGVTFYSFDSMRTLAQTKPHVFGHSSVHYFLNHQSQLYRGLGVVLVRNSVTSIAGWSAKAATEMVLENEKQSLELKMVLPAFVFGFTRVAIGYPFTTIGALIQADTENYVARSMRAKVNYLLLMSSRRIKEKGMRSFYQGFFLKGGAQVLTIFAQMSFFDWWVHPERKPVNVASFFGVFRTLGASQGESDEVCFSPAGECTRKNFK
jgi:hypothetical protein